MEPLHSPFTHVWLALMWDGVAPHTEYSCDIWNQELYKKQSNLKAPESQHSFVSLSIYGYQPFFCSPPPIHCRWPVATSKFGLGCVRFGLGPQFESGPRAHLPL
jgi:hypothetical protein